MRIVFSPYAHELHWDGTSCAEDCPACQWAEEFQSEVELVKKPSRSFVPVVVKKGLEQRLGS